MTNNIICCVMSYEITKGMKSFGPMGLLKATEQSKELITCQLSGLTKMFHTFNKTTSMSVVTGFGHDRITKKIPSTTTKILNNSFDIKNHGYAFKLLLDNILNDANYEGIFISNQNILIKNYLSPFDFSRSQIFVTKPSKKDHDDYIGPILNSDKTIDYLFYNIGDCAWSGMLYITRKDIEILKINQNSFYDHMFMFEVINTSITKYNIKYYTQMIDSKSIIRIEGVKDKQKIKEYLI